MNNEKNENNNKASIDKKENENKNILNKTNTIQPNENENIKDQKTENFASNKILSPIPLRRKSKINNINIENIVNNRRKSINFGVKFKKGSIVNWTKTKDIKDKMKDKKLFLSGSINPMSVQNKKGINININYDSNKDRDILNLFKLTNGLYGKDIHFQKEIISKKIDMNEFFTRKTNSNILNNKQQKKKIIISFGENDEKNSAKDSKGKTKVHKRVIGITPKSKDSKENVRIKDKNSFSDFCKIKQKKESKKENDTSKISNMDNSVKDEDINSKPTRAKTIKAKSGNLEIKNKMKKENASKELNAKSKTVYTIATNKNPNNDIKKTANDSNNKKESPTHKVKSKYKLKKKFCFFCCLNPYQNESDGN